MAELKEVGCLWSKQGKSGPFFAGQIVREGKSYSVLVFPNDKGENNKRPDYRIYFTGEVKVAFTPTEKPADKPADKPATEEIAF